MNAPVNARPSAMKKRGWIFSPNNRPAHKVTQSGAKFASNVALATVVNLIDQCHDTRSTAKKKPASAKRPVGRFSRRGAGCAFPGAAHSTSHISGSAKKTR